MAQKPYESDITKMMRQLLQDKPQIVEEQRKSRSFWWDKKPDPDARRRALESRVKQQAYVYGSPVPGREDPK
jgi:hypothetical protein